jgi:hypothetical protein
VKKKWTSAIVKLLPHVYLLLSILSFFLLSLPFELAFFMGSYSLLNSFLALLAVDNEVLQIMSFLYFITFLISLFVIYFRTVIKKRYKGFFVLTAVDFAAGIVFFIGLFANDVFIVPHVLALVLRLVLCGFLYCYLKHENI